MELERLQPFGHGNRPPLLAAGGVFMNGRAKVGRLGNHMKFTAYDGVSSVPAIAFRCPNIEQMVGHEAAVDLAFEVTVDEWRGRRRVQLRVQDLFAHEPQPKAPAQDLI
jgi:single-stranded-DNA-specific exonuclease